MTYFRTRGWSRTVVAGLCAGILSLGGVGATAIASTSATTHALPAVKVSWSATKTIEPTGGYPSSISCPTASFCAEVDLAGDVATKTSGSWKTPRSIDSASLVAVSCSSSVLCIAIDANNAYIFNGSKWVKHLGLDSEPMSAISCAPSSSTCIAVDDAGRAFVYSAGTWSGATAVANVALDAVSCASSTSCTAVDVSGRAYTYLGSWSAPATLGASTLTSVSCPSIHSCFAGSNSGDVFVETNGSWGNDSGVLSEGVVALSCSSSTSCVAIGGEGRAAVLAGTSWSGEAAVFSADRGVSVSCVPGGACAAVSYRGDVRVYQSGWGSSVVVDPRQGELTGVGCGSSKFCIAVDNNGRAFTWNGSVWTAPRPTGLASASGISCSGAFCIAVSVSGEAAIYKGGAWGNRSSIDSNALTAVSCSSPSYCAAVDSNDHVLTYNGASWSLPTTEGVATSVIRGYTAISCASTMLCVAVETNGSELFFGSAAAPAFLRQADTFFEPLTAVACATVALCVAFDEQGNTITYKSSGATRTWIGPAHLEPFRFSAAACTDLGYCLGMDDGGGYAAYYANAWSKGTHAALGATVAVACAGRATCVAVNATQAFASTSPL